MGVLFIGFARPLLLLLLVFLPDSLLLLGFPSAGADADCGHGSDVAGVVHSQLQQQTRKREDNKDGQRNEERESCSTDGRNRGENWPRCSLFSTRQTDANSSTSNVRGVTPPLEVRVSRLLISDWRNENESCRPLGNVMFSVTLWRRWRWRGRPRATAALTPLRGKLPVT